MTVRLLVMQGSLSAASPAAHLAAAIALTLARQGADVTRVSLADYPLPIFDIDGPLLVRQWCFVQLISAHIHLSSPKLVAATETTERTAITPR